MAFMKRESTARARALVAGTWLLATPSLARRLFSLRSRGHQRGEAEPEGDPEAPARDRNDPPPLEVAGACPKHEPGEREHRGIPQHAGPAHGDILRELVEAHSASHVRTDQLSQQSPRMEEQRDRKQNG